MREDKRSRRSQRGIQKDFSRKIRINKYFATDGSKMEDKLLVGFDWINDVISRKFRISKIASTFTAEALAIGETLENIEKIDSEQNFMIFSDSAGVLKGISNSSPMNNTLHITQMLKDKIKNWNREKKNQILLDPGALRS
jgi:hypothetical protein